MVVRDHWSWSVVLLVIILTSVTVSSNQRFRSRNAGCSHPPALVESGDCEYYRCMENSMKCGDNGFLLGFGRRYCTKIDQHRNSFSTEGKTWAEEVKKCVIRETDMALAFGDTTCYSLMEDGLYRIGQCYVSSQPSFCKILQDTRNHQVLAQILDVADLPGEESEFVVHQISDSARSCMHSEYSTSLGNINTVRDKIRQFINTMKDLLPTDTINAQQVTLGNRNIAAECQTHLDNGDCRFFECFERKFPCAGSMDASHVMHFELPTCQDMTSYIGLSNSHRARTWVQDYHKCLMNELRPLYNSNSISCATLHAFMSDKRQACMIGADMCLIKPEDFSLTLDQATNMETYPNSVPMRMLQQKLTRSHSRLPNYYFRHLEALRGQFGDALCQCRALSDGSCPPLYRVVHDRNGNSYYVMNKYHPRKTGDEDCETLGGKCESIPSGCRDPNTPKICDGPANRVCVRGQSRSGRTSCSFKDKNGLCVQDGGKCESVSSGCLNPNVQTCEGDRACVFPTTGSCESDILPDQDAKLNLYVLPTGQGEANVLQCPDGKLSIIDFGGHIGGNENFWQKQRILAFFDGKEDQIENIFISHNDLDHYNLLTKTFNEPPPGVKNIYISCKRDALPSGLDDWIGKKEEQITVTEFNGGQPCGPYEDECGEITLCTGVTIQVLAANMGSCGRSGNYTNADSLLLKLIFGSVSVLLPGDFEDKSPTSKNGPLKQVVNHYETHGQGKTLKSTVYKVSHHGAISKANKDFFRKAIGPEAVIASAKLNFRTYRHPRCAALTGYDTLCPIGLHKNNAKISSLQSKYTCYNTSMGIYHEEEGDERPIYTTNPYGDTVNLIKFSTDGEHWGITACD